MRDAGGAGSGSASPVLEPTPLFAGQREDVMPGTGFLNDLANELLPGTGAPVDLLETDGPCFAFLALGTVSGTAPTLALKMTEAATSGGTYADITGATLATQVASSKFLVLTFKRSMRFVKAVATIGG